MFSDYSSGGLKLIELRDMERALHIKIVKRLAEKSPKTWKNIPLFHFSRLGRALSVFESNVSIQNFKGIEHIDHPFYKCTLKTWLDHNHIINNEALPTVWNNIHITQNSKLLFYPNWIKAGIIYIQDILSENNEILPFEQVCNIVGNPAVLKLQYLVVKFALHKIIQRDLTLVKAGNLSFRDRPLKEWTTKMLRASIRKEKAERPHIEGFWKRKYPTRNVNKETWLIPRQCTKEVRLQTLQWKILHNIYPTRILLEKMKVANNNKCTYCQEVEYIEHFFFSCRKLEPFLTKVQRDLRAKLGRHVELNESDVILGYQKECSKLDFLIINKYIMIGKLCISKHKYGEHVNLTYLWEHEIENRDS